MQFIVLCIIRCGLYLYSGGDFYVYKAYSLCYALVHSTMPTAFSNDQSWTWAYRYHANLKSARTVGRAYAEGVSVCPMNRDTICYFSSQLLSVRCRLKPENIRRPKLSRKTSHVQMTNTQFVHPHANLVTLVDCTWGLLTRGPVTTGKIQLTEAPFLATQIKCRAYQKTQSSSPPRTKVSYWTLPFAH